MTERPDLLEPTLVLAIVQEHLLAHLLEDALTAQPGYHTKQFKLPEVEQSSSWQTSCKEEHNTIRGGWCKFLKLAKSHSVVPANDTNLLVAKYQSRTGVPYSLSSWIVAEGFPL